MWRRSTGRAAVNQGIRALNEIALRAPQAGSRDRLADEIKAARELSQPALAALLETLAAVRGMIAKGKFAAKARSWRNT